MGPIIWRRCRWRDRAQMKWALRRNGRSDEIHKCEKSVFWGMNGVAVARHGAVLKDNEAMGSGKVFKYLRGFRDIITKIKNGRQSPTKTKTPRFTVFLYMENSRYTALAAIMLDPRATEILQKFVGSLPLKVPTVAPPLAAPLDTCQIGRTDLPPCA